VHIACLAQTRALQSLKIVWLNLKLNLHNEEAKKIEALPMFKIWKV
jgi:hypothetical protein